MTALAILGRPTDCGVPSGRELVVVPASPGVPLLAGGTGSMPGVRVPSVAAAVPVATGRLTASRSSDVRVPTGASRKTRAAWRRPRRSAPACRLSQLKVMEDLARSIRGLQRCPGQLEWACHLGCGRRPEPRQVSSFVGEQGRPDQQCGDFVARAPDVVARTAGGAEGSRRRVKGLWWLVRRAGEVV